VSPPGVGSGYAWSVVVAGQASEPSSSVTSYAPPSIVSVTVSGIGVLTDEPGAVPTAGGATVTVQGRNLGDDVSAITVRWAGTAVVSGVMLLASHSLLAFSSPPGQGRPVTVTVTVGGRGVVGPSITIPYARPRVISIYLDRPLDDTSAVMDCSVVGPSGVPVHPGPTTRATLVLLGINFGDGSDVQVSVRSSPCTLVPGQATDATLVCETALCSGE
jgi:hypothetical protein